MSVTKLVNTLSDILRADNYGKTVELEVQVAGQSLPKAIPRGFNIILNEDVVTIDFLEARSYEWLRLYLFSPTKFRKRVIDFYGKEALIEESYEMIDYRILYIRDIVRKEMKFKISQTIPAYLIGVQPPLENKVRIKGIVVADKTRTLTLFIYEIEPLETGFEGFKVTDEDRILWKRYFNRDVDLTPQIAPSMVGRQFYQKALLLTVHSPAVIPDIYYDKEIRGGLRIIAFGDTKQNKSTAARDLTEYYKLGSYVSAESGSRAGLTYTIESDSNGRRLIWGALVLNDLGLVVIDGMDALHSEEMREMREALEQQKVVVTRSVSGEAYARTRIIGILNPQGGRPLAEYVYKCMALKDTFIFKNTTFVTRFDVFIPFDAEDVDPKEIAKSSPKARPVPDEVFLRHIYWVWSRRPNQIIYTEEAKEKIINEASTLIEAYHVNDLPIIHTGFRDVLTRLSVAFACLYHSTDESHEQVIVKPEHVEDAVQFIEEMVKMLQLEEYKREVEGGRTLSDDEFRQVVGELEERQIMILELIKVKPMTSSELADKLEVSVRTIKYDYELLRKHGLIRTMPGKGVELTSKGVKFLKMLKITNGEKNFSPETPGAKVQKLCTNEPSLDEKVQENCTFAPASPEENELNQYRCECGFVFSTKEDLEKHRELCDAWRW